MAFQEKQAAYTRIESTCSWFKGSSFP